MCPQLICIIGFGQLKARHVFPSEGSSIVVLYDSIKESVTYVQISGLYVYCLNIVI